MRIDEGDGMLMVGGRGAAVTGIGSNRSAVLSSQRRELARQAVDLQYLVSVQGSRKDTRRSQRTTASCSFSSSRCNSAAVNGRGWRIGI